jgi:hypothetical protein
VKRTLNTTLADGTAEPEISPVTEDMQGVD